MTADRDYDDYEPERGVRNTARDGGSQNISVGGSQYINTSPPPDFACPRCHQNDKIQKVANLVAAGSSTGYHDPWARRPTTNQTDLAARLSPPPPVTDLVYKQRLPYVLAATAALCVIVGLCSLGGSNSDPTKGIAIAWSFVCAGIFAVPALLIWGPAKRRRQRLQKQAEQVAEAMEIWETLYYCYRDDVVFREDYPDEYLRSSEMNQLLGL